MTNIKYLKWMWCYVFSDKAKAKVEHVFSTTVYNIHVYAF